MKQEYTGLTSAEAKSRALKYGRNVLKPHKKKSPLIIFFSQFMDVMTIILIACTAVTAFLGDLFEAVVMVVIVIANAFLGFVQEYRTEKTLEALREMTAPTATVLRDGNQVVISAEQVVPGDVVMVATGDKVCADGFIIETPGVNVDESILTGESEAVYKENGSLYAGTTVVSGRAVIGITDIGMHTEMGKISGMISKAESEETPLQRRLAKLGTYILIACAVICVIVTAVGILRGEPFFEMLFSGVSMAVAAVPEGLPAIVTIALAMGVTKIAAKNAMVRRLPAVETLGSTNVICSDKTGTLTKNRMTVRRTVSAGEIMGRNGCTDVKNILEIGFYCNNASDATERALAEAAKPFADSFRQLCRISEVPFSSSRKCMSVITEDTAGNRYIFTKGAPDVILKKCSAYEAGSIVHMIDKSAKERAERFCDSLASEALRVIGFAWRRLSRSEVSPDGKIKCDADSLEQGLIFSGVSGLIDPPHDNVCEAVETCTSAGIKTVMITGDHAVTAKTIAKELKIYRDGDRVVTGDELEKMNDGELDAALKNTTVFARVQPSHKLRIVRSFKRLGNTVAMTGDGVNDAPAVKEADIGISMGKNGTEVTREASSMVLLDDNFSTIVAAVREGRRIYDNICKFIRYMLACNLGEVVTMFAAVLIGLPLPLHPIQILWVNLVTDGLPGIALGVDGEESDIMQRPPIPRNKGIFTKRMVWLILFRGALTGLCTLGAFASVYFSGGGSELARTAAFMTLVLIQLVHSFECRSERKNLFELGIRGNYFLLISDAISFLLMLCVVYVPFLQGIFRTVPLGFTEWFMIMGFTAIGPVADWASEIFWDRKK